ncbi:MAG TPA: hypothetical protein VLT36_26465 [Candidatus Dormibacteraeota bacterium]|nr:hypothetical protein [Candidatus Dormibacteraeota bacterium]
MRTNIPAAGKGGVAFQLAFLYHRPGLPEPVTFGGGTFVVNFKDKELERVYELNFRAVKDSEGEDQRQICGLLAAFDWFRLIEGDQSPRVQEARDILLSAEMRPALRRWYRRFGNNMNPAAMELREQFTQLAGERFG